MRTMLAGFIASKAHFTLDGHEVLAADDIALHLTPWKMTGVGPNGTPIQEQVSRSRCCVARQTAAG